MDSVCSDEELSLETYGRKQEAIFIATTSNWIIDNNKNLNDCISTILLSEAPDK